MEDDGTPRMRTVCSFLSAVLMMVYRNVEAVIPRRSVAASVGYRTIIPWTCLGVHPGEVANGARSRSRHNPRHAARTRLGAPAPLSSASPNPAAAIARSSRARGFAFGLPRLDSFHVVQFFSALKRAGIPVTLREYLTLMEAMKAEISRGAGGRELYAAV